MLPAELSAQDFVDAFFAWPLSGMPDPRRQVRIAEPPTYNILSSTNSTIHIAFSYDEDILLQSTYSV